VVELRRRHVDDLDALVVLAGRVRALDGYPVHLPDGDLARFLTRPPPVAAWVALHARAIVGHAALHEETSPAVMRLATEVVTDGPVAFVARLFVDPSARRLGIGARLLDHARHEAVARGCVPMLDVVDTPAATAAISLYERAGWRRIGPTPFRMPDGSDGDELVDRGPVR